MANRFEWAKMIFGTIAAVSLLFCTVIGVQTVWTRYVVKDYDRHLTEQVYVDAVINQNANLVFYRHGCPYCERGKGLSLKRLRRVTIQRFISMWNQQMAKFW